LSSTSNNVNKNSDNSQQQEQQEQEQQQQQNHKINNKNSAEMMRMDQVCIIPGCNQAASCKALSKQPQKRAQLSANNHKKERKNNNDEAVGSPRV